MLYTSDQIPKKWMLTEIKISVKKIRLDDITASLHKPNYQKRKELTQAKSLPLSKTVNIINLENRSKTWYILVG